MKYKWLNKQNNKDIIIFFNGWGMDETVVSHLEFEEYDILMFYDYNNLNTDFDFSQTKLYDNISLIAWSMGVMIATLFDIDYETKTAINGTLEPISNNFGIPEKIYDLTLNGFNSNSAEKFIKSMYDEKTNIFVKRDFEEQKSELLALKQYKANKNFVFDRVILSANDKIIPTKNQVAFWGIEPNIESGHAPFNKFNKWSELL